MHSEAIDDRLVAVEKIDSQETIHARRPYRGSSERKIPGTHAMCTRLVGTNLKIFDFASLILLPAKPNIPYTLSSPFVSGTPIDPQCSDAITVAPAPVSTIRLADRPFSLHET